MGTRSIIWKNGLPSLLNSRPGDGGVLLVGRAKGDSSGNNVGGELAGRASSDDSSNNAGGELAGRAPSDGGSSNISGRTFGRRLLAGLDCYAAFRDSFIDTGGIPPREYPLEKGVLRSFRGLGYQPDVPSDLDHTVEDLVRATKAKALTCYVANKKRASALREEHYLPEEKFGEDCNQGPVQSCTSHAVTSMAQYQLAKCGLPSVPFSRLFLYKIARTLLGLHTDTGATVRETLRALGRYGCLPESDWPYRLDFLEAEPMLSDLEESRRYESFKYARLDSYNRMGEDTLNNVLHVLTDGFPVSFGFQLYEVGGNQNLASGLIPLPRSNERELGGHAVLAVGYDMNRSGAGKEKGALRIRNSWGEEWGDHGYGWLPFSYVRQQLAADFWAIYDCGASGGKRPIRRRD